MPPEPLPWDRKELLFRERKHSHERSEQLGQVARWRDSSLSSSYGGGSRNNNNNGDFSPRWGFPSDFRRPPGHGKQGGWHMYPEDSGHGYPASRFGDRFLDDDGFRLSGPRGDGRYGRVHRDNRTSFGQREWRNHSWETNHHQSVPRNASGRPHSMNDHKSTGDSPMGPSHPHSDPGDEFHSKDQTVKLTDANGPRTGPIVDKENSSGLLDWKPLKWSRSGSLTSRGSGFVHSSSSKSLGGDSNVKSDLPEKNVTPVQSPGDAVTCAPSVIPSEDTTSRKKPRLGWGEGLAKYEKKKVDGPEEYASKIGSATPGNAEPTHSFTSNLADKSPRVAGFSYCSSPATPSSVACSSSQGLDDKACGRMPDADPDPSNFSVSSIPAPENQHERLHFILDKLELNSVADLSSLISELLQADEMCSMDSGFVRSSTLNKLLLWKDDISKSLEITETEIDSLENELKSLKSDPGNCSPRPVSLNSLSMECKDISHGDDLTVIQRPPPLQVVSSSDLVVGEIQPCADAIRRCRIENKDEDVDSPGTVTSKFVEPPLSTNCQKQCSETPGLVESTRRTTQNFAVLRAAEKKPETSGQVDEGNSIHNCVAKSVENLSLCNQQVNNVCDTILLSNKDSAARTSEILDKLLPSGDYCFTAVEVNGRPPMPVDLTMKEKFLRKKRLMRFKERVLSLKYRAFQHLWKEDLRLLSLKNSRTKAQKKLFDLTFRTMQGGIQKHRSSIRSRFASPVGSLSLVPTAEVLSFTGKLLSDSQFKIYRNSLMMPAMILDEKEKSLSRFVSSNGLVEDPCAFEKERALINPWNDEEKEIFMDKLASHGKDFNKIASFLDHKTTADCIEFYYKNHKSECFAKTKKKPESRKLGKPLSSSTYLVTSEKKWSREMNAASLDILGAASIIAAQAEEAFEPSKLLSGKSRNRKPRGSDAIFEASSNCPAEDERDTTAADVLAGICGSLSSEAMGSCITSSVDPSEGNHDLKHQKVGSSGRRPLTPEVTQSIYDDTYSDESCGEMDPVDWTDDEKSLFVQAFSSYGKDFVTISRIVRTKSRDQCKIFFSKARKCLGLDRIPFDTGNGGIQGSSDVNGGGSDAEDACVVETGSDVCSDKSGSRMDEDLAHINQDVSKPDSVTAIKTLEDDCNAEELNIRNAGHEDLVPLDHEGNDSGLASGSRVGDIQDNRLATADNIPRVEGEVTTQDDTSRIGASINVIDGLPQGSTSKVDCIASTDVMGSVAILDNISEATVSQLENGHNVAFAYIELGDPPGDGLSPGSTSKDDSHPPHSSDSMMNQSESSQVQKGVPLDLSLKSELNGVVPHKVVGSEVDICLSFEDSFLRKRSHEQLESPEGKAKDYTAGLPCSSKTEKPCRNGDVKLFGQILSKPVSTDKLTQSVRMSNSKSMHCHTSDGNYEMKLVTKQDTNGSSSSSGKLEPNNCFLGLKNVPIRSYGFWDGTKIQTAYSSLPDSELLLDKYPEALANYTISTSKIDLKAVGLNPNECSVNSARVFSPGEPEGVQPFRLNMKQNDAFPEAEWEKFVKEGGVSCSGISDPVAALKLHYARAGQQYGNGGIRDESWSDGDVGR